MGGQVRLFAGIVRAYNRRGEPSVSKVIASRPARCSWRSNDVCVTRSAELLFHAGKDRNQNIDPSATHQMFNTYNARLQACIAAHHYMDTLEFHTIPGRAIIDSFGYRERRNSAAGSA